jgi:hypothetical protein
MCSFGLSAMSCVSCHAIPKRQIHKHRMRFVLFLLFQEVIHCGNSLSASHSHKSQICPFPLPPSSKCERIRRNEFPPDLILMKEITNQIILFESSSFSIHVELNRTAMSNVTFQARLIGTTIVDIPVHESAPGIYFFSYQLYDPGEYRLQIRISWFKGKILMPDALLLRPSFL